MIVIEGADLSGKTTLAEEIATMFKSKFIHLGLPSPGLRHWDELVAHLAVTNRNTIYDRACLGSIVYGKIKKDDANRYPVTDKELKRFQDYVFETHSLLIYASCTDETIRKRHRKRGDKYMSPAEIMQASALYHALFSSLEPRVQVIRYDSSSITPDDFIQENYARICAALFPATGYVTDYRARRILTK